MSTSFVRNASRWVIRLRAIRLGAGAVLAFAARFLGEIGLPGTAVLDWMSLPPVVAAAVFGPLGLLGELAVELAFHGSFSHVLLLAAHASLGLFVWLVFRFVPGISREFPTLRSYWCYVATVALLSLPAAALVVLDLFTASSWRAVSLWWASTTAALWVIGPPAILLLARACRRWAIELPGEIAAHQGLEPRSLKRAPALHAREWLGLTAITFLISALVFVIRPRIESGWLWLNLLYVFPVLWAASLFGVRGGLVLAAIVGSCVLGVQPFDDDIVAWHGSTGTGQAVTVTYSVLGALWGATQQKQLALQARLSAANDSLRRNLERTVLAFRSAIAAKDAYTEGHTRRVASYALEVGRRLGMNGTQLEELEVASLLHDVGKIGIPETILRKPGPLDSEETAILRRHPEIGARMLSQLDGFDGAAQVVLHHQERWDGDTKGDFPGYPGGLSGHQIPQGARIIAVVDAYDALTSDRPYRASLGDKKARDVLRNESGRQFDPAVVAEFLRVLDEQPWDAEQRWDA